MHPPKSPFSVRVLNQVDTDHVLDLGTNFAALLPATTRLGHGKDQIGVPRPDLAFFEHELCVQRLNDIQDWLWMCGRPMPARPLHHQLLLSRSITISEDVGLHMVWHKDRIFLKPIPLYLLNPDFWILHFQSAEKDAHRQRVTACALGLLFSYTTLIAYQSDFKIAQDHGLLPSTVTWHDWQTLTSQYLENHCYASLNPRYWYGELRMSRLNKVYKFRKSAIFRGYSRVASHSAYEDLLQDNFATLATILGYVVIVLTALQVGLGVDRLQTNQAFQAVSYGLTVFSIIAPLIAIAAILFFVLAMFAANWLETKSYEQKRFREMGVEAFWRKQPSSSNTLLA